MNQVDVLIEGCRQDSIVDGKKTVISICSSVVLVRTKAENIIIDPGGPGYDDQLLSGLSECGLKPEDIDLVINTHYHIDHVHNNFLFKNARIIAGSSLWHPQKENKVIMYDDVEKIKVDGVEFINTPGHMQKHFSVIVKTENGTIVIAGDAIRESTIKEGKMKKRYFDVKECKKSMEKIFDIADIIIPGHGPPIFGQKIKKLRKKVKQMQEI